VLLDKDLDAAFQLIINNREENDIIKENPYIFAQAHSKDGFIRHSPVLKKLQEEIGKF